MFSEELWEHVDANRLFQNYSIYIGSSADYAENTLCAGSPFLSVQDPGSFVYSRLAEVEAEEHNATGNEAGDKVVDGMVWPFGGEHWCNAEGSHVHIVADLSHLVGDYEMSICTLGVIGTRYVRTGEALPAEIQLFPGESQSFKLDHIYSQIAIGTELAIDVRLGDPALDQVTVTAREGYHEITLDSRGMLVGDRYEAVFESFNSLSREKSVLKTDRVKVVVRPEITILDQRSFKVTGGQLSTKLLPFMIKAG